MTPIRTSAEVSAAPAIRGYLAYFRCGSSVPARATVTLPALIDSRQWVRSSHPSSVIAAASCGHGNGSPWIFPVLCWKYRIGFFGLGAK